MLHSDFDVQYCSGNWSLQVCSFPWFSPLYTFATLNLNSQREFYAYFGAQWPDAVGTSLLSGGVVRVKGRDLHAAVMRDIYTCYPEFVYVYDFNPRVFHWGKAWTKVTAYISAKMWMTCLLGVLGMVRKSNGQFIFIIVREDFLFYLEQEVWRSCTNQ